MRPYFSTSALRVPAVFYFLPVLEPHRLPVAAAVARGDIAAFVFAREAPDELAGAEIHIRIFDPLQHMPARFEPRDGRLRHRSFDVEREVAVHFPARRIARRLRLLLVVEHP